MVTRVHRWLGGFDADVTGAVQVHSSDNKISIGAAAAPTANLHVYGSTLLQEGDAGSWAAPANFDTLVVESNSNGGITVGVPDADEGVIGISSPTTTGAIGYGMLWDYNAGIGRLFTSKVGASTRIEADNQITQLTLSGASGSEFAAFPRQATFGPGGTGTDLIKIKADGGTGTAAGAIFEIRQNSAFIGGLGNKAALFGSGTDTDLHLRAASGIPIVLAPNNTDSLSLASDGAAEFAGGIGVLGATPSNSSGSIGIKLPNEKYLAWYDDGGESGTAAYVRGVGGALNFGGGSYVFNGDVETDFNGNVKFSHDGAILYFGTDDDVYLEHVADSGLRLPDGDKMIFGTHSDLEIYHDSNNSALNHTGTGDFYIQSDQFYVRSATGGENFINMTLNGAVKLYHDGAEKITTSTTGVTVTGRVSDTATTANVLIPAGMIMPSGNLSTVALGGWLLCDGTAISRTEYSDLYTNIGTTFGAGNGNNTFNIPDFRDRFPLGKGTNNSTLGAQTGSTSASSALTTGTGTTGTGTTGTGTTGSTAGSTASSSTGTGTTGTGTTGTGTTGSTGGSTASSSTGTGTTGTGTSGTGTTGTGTTGGATTGGGTTGSTSVSAHSLTTTTVAASAKDSSTTTVVTAVAAHSAHTHSIPGLSVPGLSVPGLSVPGLSVPGLSIPALTIPSLTVNGHTHSVPGLSIPGLSIPALTIPSLTVNGHTHTVPGLSIPGLSVPGLSVTVPSVVVQFLIRM